MDESQQEKEQEQATGGDVADAGTMTGAAEDPEALRAVAATGGLLGASAAAGASGATMGQGVAFGLIPGVAPEEGRPGEATEDEA